MAKVSQMIIGLLTVSVIMGLFGIVFADIGTRYTQSYNSNDTAVYNKMENLTKITKDIKDREDQIVTNSNPLDKLGAFFDQGYQVARLTKNSYGVYNAMTSEAIADAGIGASGTLLKTYVGAVVIVTLIIAILVTAIIKWGI